MQQLNYGKIWDGICDQVKAYDEVDAKQVVAFFSRLHLQAFSAGFMLLTADNEFIEKWVEKHYLPFINRALTDLYHQDFMVEIVVDEAPAPAVVPTAAPPAHTSSPASTEDVTDHQLQAKVETAPPAPVAPSGAAAPDNTPTDAPESLDRDNEPQQAAQSATDARIPSSLVQAMERARAASRALNESEATPAERVAPATPAPHATKKADQREEERKNHLLRPVSNLTFSNYVIGNSNRMAYEMALAVADKPGQPQLNPLFIYGKSGVGKTHLLRAIQNHINETFNRDAWMVKTVYVDSTEFINDYANASADHSQEKASFKNFKRNYEDADVLLIDDVQSFQGKTQTLEIVFQLFNSLTSAGKQVVMSADIAPKNIDIDERYTSRFNQGATFDIQAPEVETKLAIVSAFIQEYRDKEQFSGNIPDSVQSYIAENSSANIRELKSAVTKVIYEMIYTHQDSIDVDTVARLLENHFSGGTTRRLTAADIQREVESFYQVSHTDLIGKKRSRSIAYPRQMGMYLCRQLLENNAYQRIGDEFGKKDHTTVMHSVGLIETKAKESKEVREEIDLLVKRIRER